jgi:8-oxo-dGTP pyrophosphatase MutT (NUDIX family)
MKKMKHLRKLQLIYWKIFKPETQGVRALMIKDQKILLVRHSYISGWFLPGGGIKNNEGSDEALKRELYEELGAKINKLDFLGKYQNNYEGKRDTIYCYICSDFELGKIDNKEIKEVELFSLNNLPKDISPGSKRRILEHAEGENNFDGSW